MISMPRIAAFLALALALAGGPARADDLGWMFEGISLHEAQERLIDLRNRKVISQDEMMDYARRIEPRLRGDELRKVLEGDGPKPDKFRRSGTNPAEGRGLYSDEDLMDLSDEQYRRLKRWARDKNYKIEETRFGMKIHDQDIMVWKPRQPGASNIPMQLEQALAGALDDEYAPNAMAGRANRHPLEATLENMTKGSNALFEPLPNGNRAELRLIDGAKDVVRSLDAAGMCHGEMARVCEDLEAFRKQRKSPADVGFRSLEDAQLKMRRLLGEAFRESERQFDDEFVQLRQKLRAAGTDAERVRLSQAAREMEQRAVRMGMRYEVLSNKFPGMMKDVAGKSMRRFWSEQNSRIRTLWQARTGAPAGNAGAAGAGKDAAMRTANVVINLSAFYQCMKEEQTALRSARQQQLAKCTLQAAAGLVVGELMTQGYKCLVFVTPTGAPIAMALLAGKGIYDAGMEFIDKGIEYLEYQEAEAEAEKVGTHAAQAEDKNRVRFAAQLDKEEQAIAAALRQLAKDRREILEDLELIEQEARELEPRLDLEPRRKRLEFLVAQLKPERDACYRRTGASSSAEAAAGMGEKGTEIERLLNQALTLVLACRDRSALEQGAQASSRATDLRRDLEGAMASRQAMSGVPARTADPSAKMLHEAKDLMTGLEDQARRADLLMQQTSDLRGRVASHNEGLKAKRDEMLAQYDRFRGAFAADLLELSEQHSARLQSIDSDIRSLAQLTIQESEWHPRWKKLFQTDTKRREVLDYFNGNRAGIDRVLKEMADCSERSPDASPSANPLKREKDQADKAFAHFQQEFPAKRDACALRLSGTEPTRAAPPAQPRDGATELVYVLKPGYPMTNPGNRAADGDLRDLRFGTNHFSVRKGTSNPWTFDYSFSSLPRTLRPGEPFSITIKGKAGATRPGLGGPWVNIIVKTTPGSLWAGTGGLSDTYAALGAVGDKVVSDVEHTWPGKLPASGAAAQYTIDLVYGFVDMPVVRYVYERKQQPMSPATRATAEADPCRGLDPADIEREMARSKADHRYAACESLILGGANPRGGNLAGGASPPRAGDGGVSETLAGNLLMMGMATGDVFYYLSSPSEARRLRAGERIESGATLETRKASSASVRFPEQSTAAVGENSRVKVYGSGDAKRASRLEISTGQVDITSGAGGASEKLEVASPHVAIRPIGTRYKVSVSERGTAIEVIEGSVHLSGSMLARTNAKFDVVGKVAFQNTLELKSGEKGFAFDTSLDERLTDDLSSPVASPTSPLARPDPWNDPQVQQLIDEWLRNAAPTVSPDLPGPWRFTEWGQVLGPGSKAVGAPDHPAGWTRHQSLWAKRTQFDSRNLCTMGEYVERRLTGKSFDDCARGKTAKPEMPSWLAPNTPAAASGTTNRANAAIAAARQDVRLEAANDGARATTPQLAATTPGLPSRAPATRVEMKTNQGRIVVELYPEKAPKSVQNFVQYVQDGFYDGTVFHRVIDGFMIQGGGFNEKMEQKAARAPIENEARNGLKNEPGTLAIARASNPHSGAAQFFINLARNDRLDYPASDGWGYAVFGKVVEGYDVVQQIGKAKTGRAGSHQNLPVTPVIIESARIVSDVQPTSAVDFSGEWQCGIKIGADEAALFPTITKSGKTYAIETLTSGMQGLVGAESYRVEGNRITVVHRFSAPKRLMTITLERNGQTASGKYEERSDDGRTETYPLTCRLGAAVAAAGTTDRKQEAVGQKK